jgi:glycosyltransferase involved in cell wall biosynthesis
MSRTTRILHVNKLYSPYIGGVETVLQNLVEHNFGRCEQEILVCQPRGVGARDVVNGVRVTRAGSLGIWLSMPVSLSFPFLFRKMTRGCDIVHLHHPFPLGELSALAFNAGKKLVLTWYSAIVRQELLARAYRPFLERLLDRVDAIILIYPGAHHSSEILERRVHKCHIIPPGIDVALYELDDGLNGEVESLRSRYGENLILFAGRLVYYKGLSHLIRAMPALKGRLLIAGDGPLRGQLERQAGELKVADRVHFLGRLDDRKIKAAFHACDVFVLPSTHSSEAFGMVQLEAMACRKPVVNTQLPTGVPYVSLDGETGITVEPGNSEVLAAAIQELLDDSQLRRVYGENGRTRVMREFTLQTMAERTLRVYEQVLARRQ